MGWNEVHRHSVTGYNNHSCHAHLNTETELIPMTRLFNKALSLRGCMFGVYGCEVDIECCGFSIEEILFFKTLEVV